MNSMASNQRQFRKLFCLQFVLCAAELCCLSQTPHCLLESSSKMLAAYKKHWNTWNLGNCGNCENNVENSENTRRILRINCTPSLAANATGVHFEQHTLWLHKIVSPCKHKLNGIVFLLLLFC